MIRVGKILLICVALCVVSCSSDVITIEYDKAIGDYTPIVKQIIEQSEGERLHIRFGRGEFNFYPEEAF